MGKKVRVALHGEHRRSAMIDLQATDGAKVGTNLRWADGSLITDSQIRNTAGSSTGGSTTVIGGAAVTLWQLIIGIPAIISAIAALATTGILARTGAGTVATREIQALDQRILVTDGNGVAGNPVIGMTNWPVTKNSIATGEAYTVPTGHQLIVWDTFVFDGGILTLDGDLIVIGA